MKIGMIVYKTTKNRIVCNDNLFDKLDSNSSYILGFLITDGYIYQYRPSISIGLSIKDIELLKNIKNIIAPNSNIRQCYKKAQNGKKYGVCELKFTSYKIHNYLTSIGFTHNKTGNEPLIFNIIPEEFHYDYLRGIIDGDGSIQRLCGTRMYHGKKYEYINYTLKIVSASKLFLDDINNKTLNNTCNIHKYNMNVNCWEMRTCNRDNIIKICNKIYYNLEDKIYLKRKYSIFQQIISDKIWWRCME